MKSNVTFFPMILCYRILSLSVACVIGGMIGNNDLRAQDGLPVHIQKNEVDEHGDQEIVHNAEEQQNDQQDLLLFDENSVVNSVDDGVKKDEVKEGKKEKDLDQDTNVVQSTKDLNPLVELFKALGAQNLGSQESDDEGLDKQKENNNDDNVQDQSGGVNFADLMNNMLQEIQKHSRKKQNNKEAANEKKYHAHLAALPDDVAHRITDVERQYADLVASFNVFSCFEQLFKTVDEIFERFENENLFQDVEQISFLKKGLLKTSIIVIGKSYNPKYDGMKESIHPKYLKMFVEDLQTFRDKHADVLLKDEKKTIKILLSMLSHMGLIADGGMVDYEGMSRSFVKFFIPKVKEVQKSIVAVCSLLVNEIKKDFDVQGSVDLTNHCWRDAIKVVKNILFAIGAKIMEDDQESLSLPKKSSQAKQEVLDKKPEEEQEVSRADALVYFLQSFQDCAKSIDLFERINRESASTSTCRSNYKFFSGVIKAYDFAQDVFNLYKSDYYSDPNHHNDDQWLKNIVAPKLVNSTFRAMLAWYYFSISNAQAMNKIIMQIAHNQMQIGTSKQLKGKRIAGSNAFEKKIKSDLAGLVSTMALFSGVDDNMAPRGLLPHSLDQKPTLSQYHWAQPKFIPQGGLMGLGNAFNLPLLMGLRVFFSGTHVLGRYDAFRHPVTFSGKKFAAAWLYYILRSQWNQSNSLWSPNDKHIKTALMTLLYAVVGQASYTAQYSLIKTIDYNVLSNLETYSSGIVRPQMLTCLFQAMLPLILLSDSIDRELVNYNLNLSWDRGYQHAFCDFGFVPKHLRNNKALLKTYFIEQPIFKYLIGSIVFFWGKKLARKKDKKIKSLLYNMLSVIIPNDSDEEADNVPPMTYQEFSSKVSCIVDQLKKLKLIEKNDGSMVIDGWFDLAEAEVFKTKAGSGFMLSGFSLLFPILMDVDGMILGALKLFTNMTPHAFDARSPLRQHVLGTLIRQGYITRNDLDKGELYINSKIVEVILENLIKFRLISTLRAAKVMQKLRQEPTKIGLILAMILENVQDSIIDNMVGRTCSFFASIAAKKMHESYGPFYPKIKQKLNFA